MPDDPGDITQLLARWSEGDDAAFARLMTIAYPDLRALAHRRLRAGEHDDMATTALVHEAYLKLVRHTDGAWQSRGHFYAFTSKAMRHILVDHARRATAQRRGGGSRPIEVDQELLANEQEVDEVLGVDQALERLATVHPRMAKVVELRFFGGFSMEEVAQVLDTSLRTVEREWTRAKAYLLEELNPDAS